MIKYLLRSQQHLQSLRSHRFNVLRWITSLNIAKFVLLVWICTGSSALGHGNTHEQIELLDALLKENPDQVASLLERADLHRRHRNFDEALDDLNRVRSLSPKNNTAYYLTGLTLFQQGQFSEAERVLQIYTDRSPRSQRGHLALAKVFTEQNRHLHAAREYELVIETQSTPTPDHYLARAHAYLTAGEPYLSHALTGLEEGIALMGPLLTFQRLAIDIELVQGNHQSAIDRVEMILQNVDRKETWLVRKANLLSSIGRTDEARQNYQLAEQAIDLLPVRTRTLPAIQSLRKTIHKNLKPDIQEKYVQNVPETSR